MPEDREIGRKDFFKEGPLSLLRAFMEGTREGSAPQRMPPPDEVPLLRPPGALPEAEFLEVCDGTGMCAEACPASAILIVPLKSDPDRDTPMIEPSVAACVLCDDLACMSACPTGALKPVPRESIRIGLAKIDPEECFAWMDTDDTCDYCVERCPIGVDAIRMEVRGNKKGPVVEGACTGCGVCEYHCPTYPAAIRVHELSAP